MATRSASGMGTIRKKTICKNGKQYIYWEARITTGHDPGSGRQIQRSFTGKTQKEVREKLQEATVSLNTGTYVAPSRMTVGQWLELWAEEYLTDRKPGTVSTYATNMKNHIKPALGAVRLSRLHPHQVQTFVNDLEGLAPSSVRLIYKILHMALEKAVQLGYLGQNPAANCALPRADKKEIRPLGDPETAELLTIMTGTELEPLVRIALFTGMRLSELLGLTWDCVDWKTGALQVSKQLTLPSQRQNGLFQSPKSGKSRTILPAAAVLTELKKQQIRQAEQRLKAGPHWQDSAGLAFTLADGQPLDQWRVQRRFRALLQHSPLEQVRFHDLRHTYAVNAIRAGDDIKTVQSNLGHSSAAFTLDRYAHFTAQMQSDSARRMDAFIRQNLLL